MGFILNFKSFKSTQSFIKLLLKSLLDIVESIFIIHLIVIYFSIKSIITFFFVPPISWSFKVRLILNIKSSALIPINPDSPSYGETKKLYSIITVSVFTGGL